MIGGVSANLPITIIIAFQVGLEIILFVLSFSILLCYQNSCYVELIFAVARAKYKNRITIKWTKNKK